MSQFILNFYKIILKFLAVADGSVEKFYYCTILSTSVTDEFACCLPIILLRMNFVVLQCGRTCIEPSSKAKPSSYLNCLLSLVSIMA